MKRGPSFFIPFCLIVFGAWGLAGELGFFSKPHETKELLQAEGYENVEVMGWVPTECADESFSTSFRAEKNGEAVSGTVCSGVWKGSTIRFD